MIVKKSWLSWVASGFDGKQESGVFDSLNAPPNKALQLTAR
jgi:hypothetical protein